MTVHFCCRSLQRQMTAVSLTAKPLLDMQSEQVTSIHHATKAKQSWRTLGRDRQNGKTYRGCSESDFLKAGLLVHIHVCPHDEMYIREKLLSLEVSPECLSPFEATWRSSVTMSSWKLP